MNLLKCPKCGEMFSDSYKECPFCQEDEAYLSTDKKVKGRGRRVEKTKSPSILGPALIIVVLLLAAFLVYTFFGSQIADFISGANKPEIVEPVEPDDVTPEELTLDQTELKLTEGDTATLTASGAESYQWISSDEAVATVDENGTVTAVAAGTATISVSAEDASAACVITVEIKEETKPATPAKDLRLCASVNPNLPKSGDSYDFGMSVGDEFELYIDGTDSTVTWKSSDTSKVTISSDGTIKRVASGEVEITATVDGQTIKALVR